MKNRLGWYPAFMLTAFLIGGTGTPPMASGAAGANYFVYFGTYTGPKSKGIYVAEFDSSTGKAGPVKFAGEAARPSWVALHPNGRYLYSVSEVGGDAKSEGAISSFSIDKASGELKSLNTVPSGGGGPCHLAIDKAGKMIFVANYSAGNVSAFSLSADGSIGKRTGFQQHQGSSINANRQKGPHAHAVVLSPDNKFLFVPDLGLDEYISYRVGADGSLTPNDPPFVKIKAGSGPRHFAFHPDGKFAYGVNEMGSSVTAFSYNPAKGALKELETVSMLPQDFKGESNAAEIQVDGSGRYVYASNRGHDSIAVFAVNGGKRTLTSVEHVSTQGKVPRNFSLDPTGRYLLAANQNTNNVVIFSRDAKTGKLTPTGQTLEAGSPVCIQFLRK